MKGENIMKEWRRKDCCHLECNVELSDGNVGVPDKTAGLYYQKWGIF